MFGFGHGSPFDEDYGPAPGDFGVDEENFKEHLYNEFLYELAYGPADPDVEEEMAMAAFAEDDDFPY